MSPRTTWIVTRHPGALEFLTRRGITGEHREHLRADELRTGDRVIGTLPLPVIAHLSTMGIEYWHLAVELEPTDRGQELSADRLEALGASLRQYRVFEV